jgi:hypothetical protein
MTLTLTAQELDGIIAKYNTWFYGVLNDVVPKMASGQGFMTSTDRDYRDRCARLIKEYANQNPKPDWRNLI